jgi:hypothetical protein
MANPLVLLSGIFMHGCKSAHLLKRSNNIARPLWILKFIYEICLQKL